MNTEMTPLNYCRDMAEQSRAILNSPMVPERIARTIRYAIDIAGFTQKFMLPEYGLLLDDKELKALGDDELHLPYKTIILEYAYPDDPDWVPPEGRYQFSRRILFATELDEYIHIIRSQRTSKEGVWVTSGPVLVPKKDWADRSILGDDGRFALGIADISGQTDIDPQAWRNSFADDVWVLVALLNALACSNVTTQPLKQPAPFRSSQPKKNPKPQDVYHVLVLTTDPDQPATAHGTSGPSSAKREHMRRGHIRRLADGRKLWINATVVNAGHNFGRVSKDYQVKA